MSTATVPQINLQDHLRDLLSAAPATVPVTAALPTVPVTATVPAAAPGRPWVRIVLIAVLIVLVLFVTGVCIRRVYFSSSAPPVPMQSGADLAHLFGKSIKQTQTTKKKKSAAAPPSDTESEANEETYSDNEAEEYEEEYEEESYNADADDYEADPNFTPIS